MKSVLDVEIKGWDLIPVLLTIGGAVCKICDGFTSIQREMLATPQYQICTDKKAGLLVSPKDVTVLSPVNSTQQQDAANAHAQLIDAGQQHELGTAHAQHLPGGSDVSSSVYVSKKDFNNLSQQLDQRFARFEALLSCGNIFATPKVLVNVINPPVSQQPFIDPNASARATSPVWFPAEQASKEPDLKTSKKHKSSYHKSSKSKPLPVGESTGLVQEAQTDTYPQTEPVLVVTKPLTSLEPAAPAGEPVVGIFDSAGVSAAATGVEHPLLDNETTFAVSPDEPLFGENVQPVELVSDEK